MRNIWIGMYIRAVLALMISLIIFVGIIPQAISAKDSLIVIAGITGGMLWPACLAAYFLNYIRKISK